VKFFSTPTKLYHQPPGFGSIKMETAAVLE